MSDIAGCFSKQSHFIITASEWHWSFFWLILYYKQQEVSNTMVFCLVVLSHEQQFVSALQCFHVLHSHHILSHDLQKVSDAAILILFHAFSSYLLLCMNNNRMWVTLQWISTRQSHHISFHDQQDVSDTTVISCHSNLAHLISWPIGSEFHCSYILLDSFVTSHQPTDSEWHSSNISPCSFIISDLMPNSLWVTL